MKHRFALSSALALTLALSGCAQTPETLPAPGHHMVTIDTDAWLPLPVDAAVDPARPAPLFDRLSITVLRDGQTESACKECTRDFAVDLSTFGSRGATFAVESSPGERPLVRAQLYRSDSVVDGRLREETAIVVTAHLPVTPREGEVETTIHLLTTDVGSSSAAQPLEPSTDEGARVRPGHPDHTQVGTWAGASRLPCTAEAGPGEVCVPGGAYWMGNPLVKGDGFVESDKQRLVVLSPFYLDEREVTVADVRAWAASQSIPVDITPSGVTSEDGFCTFTSSEQATDDKPVNCVGWETARRYCEDRGGTLPSEAQFEYASSALRSALYIWGQDEAAICQAAVWGRASANLGQTAASSKCATSGEGAQALPSDPALSPDALAKLRDQTRATDKIVIGDKTIYDLAGNLQEWTLDRYNKQDESCWQAKSSNVFVDPVCDTPGALAAARSVRGGSWVQDRAFLRAAYRKSRAPDDKERYVVGFRCARPGR